MKYITFIIFLLFNISTIHAEYFKHLGMSNGLSQLSVLSICQDSLGRMWFGTKEGISVYDGNSIVAIKAYAQNHSFGGETLLIDNDINTIQGDREGNIFLLARNSLIKYDIRKETYRTITTEKTRAVIAHEGRIWCIVGNDLFLYNDKTDSLNFVMSTPVDNANWLTVTKDKFYISNRQGLYAIERSTQKTVCLIPDTDIYRTFESSSKELWVGCRMKGLYRISPQGDISKVPYTPDSPHGIGSHQIRDFCEDSNHNIWFGTFDGLQKYNSQTGEYSLIRPNKNVGGPDHPSIFAVYKDRQGVIWLGSYYGGVNYFDPGHELFKRYNYDQSADKDLFFSYIGEMAEDKNGLLWFCTDGGGFSCLNRHTQSFTNYKAGNGNALPHNNVKSICYDPKRHQLYIGTYLGGLSRFDIATKTFHNYHQYPFKGDAPGNIIHRVLFRNDRLYLSSNKGFFVMDPETNQFKCFETNAYCQNFDVDNKGNAWLLFWENLVRINLNNPEEVTSINLKNYGGNFQSTKIKVTSSGVYFGTLGSGLFFYNDKTKEVVNYNTAKGQLLSDYCYNIAITKSGNLLLTCEKGITIFSPVSQTFRSLELPLDFPAPAIINDCGTFVTSDNQIFVGDIKGLTSFYENDMGMHNGKLKLYFSQLAVNNQIIYPNDETGILQTSLPFNRALSLAHDQNNLTINFALSNYSDIQQSSRYEYKLEGFDKQWISTKDMSLHYTNLDPGNYTLHIRSKNNGFNTETEQISLPISISSPWYNSFWSWVLYISVTAYCIHYYFRSRTARKILALSLEREQFEKKQIEQMNHAKLLFFTNVSHEFRTPLTLIISHIDQLLQKTNMSASIYNHILKIHKNAQQMTNLVTELLDFRKFEQNHVVLKVTEENIVTFLKEIYFSFYEYAQQRNITFLFTSEEENIQCWFDSQQMEKVFFNLLSNAFKFTPDNGTIELRVSSVDDICIEIIDNGTGIESAETSHIFDRFYQASHNQEDIKMNPGTGIGLALTKIIVDKHHGEIYVESEKGKGSTFVIHLQKGNGHFESDKESILLGHTGEKSFISSSLPIVELQEKQNSETGMPEDIEIQASDLTTTILLVEDNKELLEVLQQLFSPYYKTLIACNGKEGLDIAISEKPNLIVSDIMMPEMTGTEMCLQIKNDIDLCHIPVVLLTALNTNEQNIEGLNSGADDYVTKPFNAKILLARCNNLIKNRVLIQQQFNERSVYDVDLTAFTPLDKDLIKRTIEIVDAHLDDPEFDIPKLCKEVGMGRTLLYSKFKALTGMTPNNFILSHKLKHACNILLKYPEMQIAEVADKLGFGSAVYFARCFKNEYNESPQSYRKTH